MLIMTTNLYGRDLRDPEVRAEALRRISNMSPYEMIACLEGQEAADAAMEAAEAQTFSHPSTYGDTTMMANGGSNNRSQNSFPGQHGGISMSCPSR